ncbi:hypothetical protein Stube_34610 [Streptomyces tubercidicus]|uniref:Uncharacterized protein n=1 Tax=Streptomyces tubercidicus TaxID=47759 RepID=A0A640URQ9_9ACTN|nr:hypothetical protein Stube_34610 [Streptomyces tubercidicus]
MQIPGCPLPHSGHVTTRPRAEKPTAPRMGPAVDGRDGPRSGRPRRAPHPDSPTSGREGGKQKQPRAQTRHNLIKFD